MRSLARPSTLRRIATAALDVVLPPRCLACGTTVGETGTLCAPCWRAVTFLGGPCCDCCGIPFEFDLGAGTLCGACARQPPPFDRARAVMRYDAASRKLVLAFKHSDKLHLAPAFGTWLKRAGGALAAEAQIAVPVPLHWTRLFARRYNQSAVLAHALAAAGGPAVGADWLIRRRRTPSQGKRNAAQRERNVKSAFALRPGRTVKGLRVLLIDDVFTTGATVGECARVLRRAGAAGVDVLTLARTVRQEG